MKRLSEGELVEIDQHRRALLDATRTLQFHLESVDRNGDRQPKAWKVVDCAVCILEDMKRLLDQTRGERSAAA
jgi:hypothetical protein